MNGAPVSGAGAGCRMLREMARFLPSLLPVLLLLVPCAQAPAQTVSLNVGGRPVRIDTGDAAVLPGDFPPDVALPDRHVVVQVKRAGSQVTVDTEAPGDIEAVLSRLRERMLASGWVAAKVVQPPTGQAQAWEKEHRAVVAWVTPAASGVRVQLRLLPRR
jgi:hypothetical protein